jgi:phosphocarrier protein
MRRIEVKICNRLGLHARAAARFVHIAHGFRSRITVTHEARRVDGKSILGLLTLAAARGSSVVLSADGDDEEHALAALQALIDGHFEEAE